jgi:hypothetical protein
MGIKISALTPIATPAYSDVFPVVQSGVTYKESFTQLQSLFAISGANTNITSMTGLTGVLKAPTAIQDSSGANIVTFASAASAVNYIQLESIGTGNGPMVSAFGSDTDVNLVLLSQRAGTVNLQSTSTATAVKILSGTAYQHETDLSFSNTATTRTVTFPDQNGTIYLANKANGTEAANAVTANGTEGVITTSALTTAGGANYAITWTNSFIASTSTILLTIMGGTNTTNAVMLKATAGSGSSTLTIYNLTAATALNGTILIGYMVIP